MPLIPWLLFCALAQSSTLLERADEAFRQGDLDRAATLAQQVLAGNPGAVHAHMIAGVVAAQNGRWEVSDRHFAAVVKLEPSNPHRYFYLGQAKLYQKKWQAAIAYFLKALERQDPDRARLMVEMALAQNEAGHPRQALDTLSKAAAPADPRLAAQYYAVTSSSERTCLRSRWLRPFAHRENSPIMWKSCIYSCWRAIT
ncbi:MAG TPA: tetratricopeptide repeat protein [Bryobacteraceae bacterium]|nr:tetratricopeptide repeat protein [Bryobacteraceae bacterium]